MVVADEEPLGWAFLQLAWSCTWHTHCCIGRCNLDSLSLVLLPQARVLADCTVQYDFVCSTLPAVFSSSCPKH